MRFLEPADVVAAAAELAGGADPLGEVDLPGLDAALLRVRAAEPEDAAEAAALLFAHVSRSRPFPAANQAVAWLAACQLLSLNGGELPGGDGEDLGRLLGEVAAGADVGRLTEWIRARCAPAGRRDKKGVVMFERFTDDAREVVEQAQVEAKELGHDFLGTEHLLLGLLGRGGGAAEAVLTGAGVTAQAVRDGIRSLIGPSAGTSGKAPHFTPRTKKVLELSLREAMTAKSRRIGPEHILLATIREGSGVAAGVLEDLGVDAGALRRDLTTGGAGTRSGPGPRVEGIDLGACRQRVLGDLDTLTGRILQLEAECERLRGVLHRHGIEADGGERSA